MQEKWICQIEATTGTRIDYRYYLLSINLIASLQNRQQDFFLSPHPSVANNHNFLIQQTMVPRA